MKATEPKPCEEPGGKHDWRVDPMLCYADGSVRLVCADCEAVTSGGPGWQPPSADPKQWEKWTW